MAGSPGTGGRLSTAAAWWRARLSRARRWSADALIDLREWRAGTRDPLLPPRRKDLPSQAPAAGEHQVGRLRERAGLVPTSAVLDIGCGAGRVAAALTRYLDPASGSYEGFDIVPESIKWCSRAIGKRHPNFHFQVADLHNAQYNPKGSQRADEYVFPYPDESFDVAIATSLFTHLRPFEGQRYLDEACRVLRPGGRLLTTWFLINDEADELLERDMAITPGVFEGPPPPLKLPHSFTDERGNPFRSRVAATPEYMIAIGEQLALSQHERAGLEVIDVLYGSWPGRKPRRTWPAQDAILAERPAAER
jgi:SAM-dependent methyltransferase